MARLTVPVKLLRIRSARICGSRGVAGAFLRIDHQNVCRILGCNDYSRQLHASAFMALRGLVGALSGLSALAAFYNIVATVYDGIDNA